MRSRSAASPAAGPPSRDPNEARFEGLDADALAVRLGIERAIIFREVSSTLDVAHEVAAAGAPAGTLVIAHAQTAGRGRARRAWVSAEGKGLWLTVIERPADAGTLDVLSLRVGILLAPMLDRFAETMVQLKWPNDFYVGRAKLGGILIEARWREQALEWVSVGVGINARGAGGEQAAVRDPGGTERTIASLRPDIDRLAALDAVVRSIRAAASGSGPLTDDELREFRSRDLAAGRNCVEPLAGRVQGIDASGALLIDVGSGLEAVRAGSLILMEEQ